MTYAGGVVKLPRAATREDVIRAIQAERLRVDVLTGEVWSNRGGKSPVWRQATFERVCGPHQKLGYDRVRFAVDLLPFRCLVHRVVWFAAGYDIEPGMQINHRDGNKQNNALSNLEKVSSKANLVHAIETGLLVHANGQTMASRSRVTAEQVREIRNSNLSQPELAERFGIDQSAISRIRARKSYRWVE